MLDGMGSLFDWPWIYALVALSVILDVFLPVLPSGVLVISAATAGSSGARNDVLDVFALLVCAAAASCLGDLLAYRLAFRGGDWFENRVAGSRRMSSAHERLGQVLTSGGGALVVLARFAPAGRSVVSLGAGAARRRPGEFLPWSALAGVCWATYSVGLGWIGAKWLGASWLGTLMSFVALTGAGAFAAYVFRRERRLAIATYGPASGVVPGPAYVPVPVSLPMPGPMSMVIPGQGAPSVPMSPPRPVSPPKPASPPKPMSPPRPASVPMPPPVPMSLPRLGPMSMVIPGQGAPSDRASAVEAL